MPQEIPLKYLWIDPSFGKQCDWEEAHEELSPPTEKYHYRLGVHPKNQAPWLWRESWDCPPEIGPRPVDYSAFKAEYKSLDPGPSIAQLSAPFCHIERKRSLLFYPAKYPTRSSLCLILIHNTLKKAVHNGWALKAHYFNSRGYHVLYVNYRLEDFNLANLEQDIVWAKAQVPIPMQAWVLYGGGEAAQWIMELCQLRPQLSNAAIMVNRPKQQAKNLVIPHLSCETQKSFAELEFYYSQVKDFISQLPFDHRR